MQTVEALHSESQSGAHKILMSLQLVGLTNLYMTTDLQANPIRDREMHRMHSL